MDELDSHLFNLRTSWLVTVREEHLNTWHTFVMGCRLLTVPSMTYTDLVKADMLLLKFCCQFELLYAKDNVRIKMHLHCHLKECIEDYGPVYSFWCFAFDGTMESLETPLQTIDQLKYSL